MPAEKPKRKRPLSLKQRREEPTAERRARWEQWGGNWRMIGAPGDDQRPSERILARLVALAAAEGIEVWTLDGQAENHEGYRTGEFSPGGSSDLPVEHVSLVRQASPHFQAWSIAQALGNLRGGPKSYYFQPGPRARACEDFAMGLLAALWAAEALALPLDC